MSTAIRTIGKRFAALEAYDSFLHAASTSAFVAYYVGLHREEGTKAEAFAWALGVIGFWALAEAPLEVATGLVADRWGRRASIILSGVCRAIACLMPIFGFLFPDREAAGEVGHKVEMMANYGFVIVASTLFSGSLDAWATDLLKTLDNYSEARLREAFVFTNLIGSLGLVSGSIVGLLLLWSIPNASSAFPKYTIVIWLGMMLLCLGFCAMAGIWMDEPYRDPYGQNGDAEANKNGSVYRQARAVWGTLWRTASLRNLTLGWVCLYPLTFVIYYTLPYYVDRMRPANHGDYSFIDFGRNLFIPMFFYYFFRFVGSSVATWISRTKLTDHQKFIRGTLVSAVSACLVGTISIRSVAIPGKWWMVCVGAALFGISRIGFEVVTPLQKSLFNDAHDGSTDRATLLSLQSASGGVATFVVLGVTAVAVKYLLVGASPLVISGWAVVFASAVAACSLLFWRSWQRQRDRS